MAMPVMAEDPPTTTKSSVIVVSSDDGKGDEMIAKVREQLDKSGLPKEQQEKILEQLQSALANAKKSQVTVTSTVNAENHSATDEKDSAGGLRARKREMVLETIKKIGDKTDGDGKPATKQRVIIVDENGNQQELKMEELQRHLGEPKGLKLLSPLAEGELEERLAQLPSGIQGRVLQLQQAGDGPVYRIGIAINRTVSEEGETEDLEGLVVEDVMDDSPALKAGIKKGDVVISVNGKEIEKFESLQEAVQEAGKSEKAITLQVERDGKDIKVEVKPTKTESPDLGSMNVKLAPQSGFIFAPGQPMPQGMGWASGGGAMFVPGGEHESLKKEVQDLKSEVSELKSLIKKLLDK
jgi:hypothetical protein